ncbi:MAG: hypothetical protein LBL49_08005 [Clostridiales Family XIII bacterium]|nr:hypothetical protein [Clostridiales Family XIII bacterium]
MWYKSLYFITICAASGSSNGDSGNGDSSGSRSSNGDSGDSSGSSNGDSSNGDSSGSSNGGGMGVSMKLSMKRMIIMAGAILAGIVLSAAVYAASLEPGSEEDPLVTKSYLDQKLSAAAVFVPLEVKEGQTLIGDEGAEIILRSGEASAIGNEENGISDLTAGKDLMSGDILETNHLLLIPRSDGRGITAITDIWLMIKGGYSLQTSSEVTMPEERTSSGITMPEERTSAEE